MMKTVRLISKTVMVELINLKKNNFELKIDWNDCFKKVYKKMRP